MYLGGFRSSETLRRHWVIHSRRFEGSHRIYFLCMWHFIYEKIKSRLISRNACYYSHHKPVCLSLLSHACHMPCPSHSPWSDIPVIFGAKHTCSSSLRRVFQPPTTSSPIVPDSLFSLLLSNAWFILTCICLTASFFSCDLEISQAVPHFSWRHTGAIDRHMRYVIICVEARVVMGIRKQWTKAICCDPCYYSIVVNVHRVTSMADTDIDAVRKQKKAEVYTYSCYAYHFYAYLLYFINVWHVYEWPKTHTWSGTFILKDGRYTFLFFPS
jgi:hypothetical protein